MSYILEALKKSEQERQHGAAPGLQTVQTNTVRHERKRVLWPYLLVGALLMNAGLLAWAFGLGPSFGLWKAASSRNAERAVSAQKAVPAEGASERPSVDLAGVGESITYPAPDSMVQAGSKHREAEWKSAYAEQGNTTTEGEKPTELSRREEQEERRSSKAEAISVQSSPPPASERAPDTPRTAQDRTFAVNAPPGDGVKRQQSESLTSPKREQTKPIDAAAYSIQGKEASSGAMKQTPADLPKVGTPAGSAKHAGLTLPLLNSPEASSNARTRLSAIQDHPTEPVSGGETEKRSKKNLPTLTELPLSVQRSLPEMSFSFFVYSRNADDRMVSINGRMRREGEEVAAGLKLEEITPEGAIFTYQGHRFLRRVF